MDRLTSMEVFVCAVEKRSFTAAATTFRISPTMVGKHIRYLEERVGARLVNRTTRQQSLTEVGQIYYDRCKQIVGDVELADASAAELTLAPRGVLRIQCPVSFGSQKLTPALVEYFEKNPQVRIELSLSDRPIHLVDEGFDAAIRIGSLADSNLIARRLRPYKMMLCASPAYLSKFGVPKAAQDLSKHECLGFSYWKHRNTWKLKESDLVENVSVQGRLLVNNGQALKMAALAGLGIIMQPEVLVGDEIIAGRLKKVLPRYELPSKDMYIVYQADKRLTPKLRSFIDFVVKGFG